MAGAKRTRDAARAMHCRPQPEPYPAIKDAAVTTAAISAMLLGVGGLRSPRNRRCRMIENPLDRIEINPEVMLGKPVIRGSRITVEIILEKIASGSSIEDIQADYPRLTRDDVLAAVAFARQAVGTDEYIPRVRGRG
jgi:uncharacterized protein (DUF433 family)